LGGLAPDGGSDFVFAATNVILAAPDGDPFEALGV
jgi:hypothetical protein